MAPSFAAIRIVDYAVDDTYDVPALLDQARQSEQLTHRSTSPKAYLLATEDGPSSAALVRQCSTETPRLACDCSAALMGPRTHAIGFIRHFNTRSALVTAKLVTTASARRHQRSDITSVRSSAASPA